MGKWRIRRDHEEWLTSSVDPEEAVLKQRTMRSVLSGDPGLAADWSMPGQCPVSARLMLGQAEGDPPVEGAESLAVPRPVGAPRPGARQGAGQAVHSLEVPRADTPLLGGSAAGVPAVGGPDASRGNDHGDHPSRPPKLWAGRDLPSEPRRRPQCRNAVRSPMPGSPTRQPSRGIRTRVCSLPGPGEPASATVTALPALPTCGPCRREPRPRSETAKLRHTPSSNQKGRPTPSNCPTNRSGLALSMRPT